MTTDRLFVLGDRPAGTFDHRTGTDLPSIGGSLRPGSWPGCREKRFVRLSELQLRSRLDFSEFEADGGFYAACGHCDNCTARKVDSWVGRIIGESHGSEHCYFVTLTVGGDKYMFDRSLQNERARKFFKTDVQAYFKRLKKYLHYDWANGLIGEGLDPSEYLSPTVRYYYVGERGEEATCRTHYHLLVFVNGMEVPTEWLYRASSDLYYEPRERFFHGKMDASAEVGKYPWIDRLPSERTYWPWGFCQWKPFESSHASYVSRYLSKQALLDRGAGGQFMRPGYTTKPVFGGYYADVIAAMNVEAGLSPQDNMYTVPPREGYAGKLHRFFFPKSCLKLLANQFAHRWDAENPGREAPWSDMLARFFAANELRKLGTPAAEMCRAQFFAVARRRLEGYGVPIVTRADGSFLTIGPPLTVEFLADVQGAIVGSGRNQIADMQRHVRTEARIADIGRRTRPRATVRDRDSRISPRYPGLAVLQKRHKLAIRRWRKLGLVESEISARLIAMDAVTRLGNQS